MGMDIFGVNPTSDKGSYFRNNVWWWRPLAIYCVENHAEITEACEYWQSNDGDGLDEADSLRLAEALQYDLDNGIVAEYERKYNEWRASLPREKCPYCKGKGIRKDKVGLEMAQHDKELSPEVQILTGRTHGWCNGCDGVGTQESIDAAYPFSEENVREFVEFLRDCGGFQIC